MGYFSWKTSDTNRSIANRDSGKPTFPVFVLLPDGRVLLEECYEGYGVFDGRDFFGLVAEINGIATPEVARVGLEELLAGGDVFEELEKLQRHYNEEFDRTYRGKGINLCNDTDETDLKFPRLVEDPKLKWEDVPDSPTCELQGFFYGEE